MIKQSLFLILLLYLLASDPILSSTTNQFCNDNQFLSKSTYQCIDCNAQCNRCIEQSCLSCLYGEKKDGECLNLDQACDEGQFLNLATKQCQNCNISFCQSCSEQNQCKTCYNGFTLIKDSECIKDENSAESDKYYSYACPSLSQDNNGDCTSQEICSSFTFRKQTSFEQNIKMIVEYNISNLIIGISNSQVIVFKGENMIYYKELLNLQQSQNEYIISQTLFKNFVAILSSQSIYIFNLDTFKLETRFQFEANQIANDSDNRKIFYLDRIMELIYFALTNNSQNIRQIIFEVIEVNQKIELIYSTKNKQNTLLLSEENDFIQKFFFFPQYQLFSFISLKKVSFIDLKTYIENATDMIVSNQQSQNSQVFLSKKNSSSSLLTFYAIKQTQTLQYILKIQYDINNNEKELIKIKTSYDWQFFNDQTIFYEFKYYNWFTYELDNSFYVLLIAHQDYKSQVIEQKKFIGIAEIEYFFSGNSYYSFEYHGIFNWFKDQIPLISNQNPFSRNLILFIPFQNQIQVFEILKDEKEIKQMLVNISFDNTDAFPIIIKSSYNYSQYFLILNKIAGKFLLRDDNQKITSYMSSKMLYQNKDELYLEQILYDQVFIPAEIKEKNSKYTFVIINSLRTARISIIQVEGKPNGEQVMIAQNFISHSSNNGNESNYNYILDTLIDDEFELIQITTQKGVFQIKYYTLEILRYIPIINITASLYNLVLYHQVEADQNTGQPYFIYKAIELSSNPRLQPDQTYYLGEFQYPLNKIPELRVNKMQREMYFFLVQQDQNIKSLVISYQGHQSQALIQIKWYIKIISIHFLNENQLGLVIIDNDKNLQFLKLLVKLDDQKEIVYEQFYKDIPQGLDCSVYEYAQIATCNRQEEYDENENTLRMYIFKWETMSFLLNDTGDLLGKRLTNFGKYEEFRYETQEIIERDNVHHIYTILRQYQVNESNQIVKQAEVTNIYFTLNLQTEEYVFINQSFHLISISSELFKIGEVFYYSDTLTGNSRFISPQYFLDYASFIDNGVSFLNKSYAFWKSQFSLMFIQQNKLIVAKRFGQFKMPNKISYNRYLFSFHNLGLVAIQLESQIQFIAIDNLQIMYSIDIEPGANILFSQKFNSLLIQNQSKIFVYFQQTQFSQYKYFVDLSELTSNENIKCFILQETTFLACHKLGLFDYEHQLWYLKPNLLIYKDRQLQLIRDNKYYAIFNEVKNMFIFSHLTKSFLENKKLEFTLGNISLILHPQISDQVIALMNNQGCAIYSLPSFYQIFSFTFISDDLCFYDSILPSLIIKTDFKITIHQLPYNISKKPTQLGQFISSQNAKYITTKEFLYTIYSEKYLDSSFVTRIDTFNLITAETKSRKMILVESLQKYTLQQWEEKDIIFTENLMISLSDIGFGWSTPQTIFDYSDRFNYIYTASENNEYFQIVDVSEMFPFSQESSQFINYLDIQNQNIYQEDSSQLETIIYFNNELFKVMKSSFNSDTSTTLLDLQSMRENLVDITSFISSYKTSYQLFNIKNLDMIREDQNNNIYGLKWKCRLLIFRASSVIKLIDLKMYNCQLLVIGDNVFLQNKNQLQQIIFTNESISVLNKQLNGGDDSLIENIYTDSLCRWILVLYKNKQNVLYLNSENDEKLKFLNIDIQSTQITLVKFISYQGLNILIIGKSDSNIIILQLHLPQSNFSNIEASKQNNQLHFFSFHLFSNIIGEIYRSNLECSTAKMAESFIEQHSENQFRVFIYITCDTRVYNLEGIYDSNTNVFVTQIEKKTYSLLHTRTQHKIKVLENRFISIFSQLQATIYSSTLQYIARIEEKSFKQINDIFLAPNLYTVIVTDTNAIFVYSIKQINSRQRLILQSSFQYIMPIIYSIKFATPGKPMLILKGVDSKDVFNFQYLPQSMSSNKENSSCLKQIQSIDSEEQQQQQYISILKNANDYSDSTINVYLSVQKGQTLLKLPIIDDMLIFLEGSPFLQQRIHLDVNLNNQNITLVQSKSIDNPKNLLRSLKITNGQIKIAQTVILNSMVSVVLKDVKLIYEKESLIDIRNTKEVRIDNSELEFQKLDNNNRFIFSITNVSTTIINKLSILNQSSNFLNLFHFVNCTYSLLKQINISNSIFLNVFPLINFEQQTGNIIIQDIHLNQTIMNSLMKFTDTQNISLKNINITELQSQQQLLKSVFEDEVDQDKEEETTKLLPLIYSEFAQQEISISNIKVQNSTLNSLLQLQNWMNEVKTQNSVQIKVQRISSKSRTELNKINFINTTFYQDSINVDDNYISINTINFTSTKDGKVDLKNAKIKMKNIFILNHLIDKNNILIKVYNSDVHIQNIQVSQTQIIQQLKQLWQQQEGYITFINSTAVISGIQAINNNISCYFLKFQGIYSNNKVLIIRTNKNPDVQIVNCQIKNNKGGGIILEQLNDVVIQDCKINNNQGQIQGSGIQIIQATQTSLKKVEIIGNRAILYGGGVYLNEANLSLEDCQIKSNYAIIGGGIRYFNQNFLPTFLKYSLKQIENNDAIIFGNNYGSMPKTIKMYYNNNSQIVDEKNIIEAVSSSSQQLTQIDFQLFDEENCLVKLPNKLNQQIEMMRQIEITNYINSFSLSKVEISKVYQILQEELHQYYNFKLFSQNDILGQISIQQKNLESSYDANQNFTHSFKKYILKSGYSFLPDYSENDQLYQFEIQSSISNLNIQFYVKFRKCEQGEIIKQVGKDFYECLKCSDNTYSLTDPYQNNLQNTCSECPQGAQSCSGNQIVPLQGYWVQQGYEELYYCINTASACQYNPTSRNPCIEGYAGPLCESCDYDSILTQGSSKYYAKKGKYSCTICSDKLSQTTQILFSLFLGIAFLLYLSYQIASNFRKKVIKMQLLYLKRAQLLFISNSLNGNEKSSFALKIMIGYFQIISIVFSFKVQIPEAAKSIQLLGSSLETTLYSLDCIYVKQQLSQQINMVYLRLLWILIQPFLYISFLSLIYFIFSFFKNVGTKNRKKNLFLSGLLKLYYMVYPSIIQQVIGTLSCKNINNQSYVLNDLQFKCYDNQYFTYNFIFGLPILFVALITPYLILRKLRKSKEHITQDPNIFISYGFYFSEYKYKYCYWEIIKIYQKIIIFTLVGFFNENNMISSILVSIIIIFYLKFQLQISPFTYLQFNQLDHLSQITAVITILSLVINITSNSDTISALSLFLVVKINFYFLIKFIACFSFHIIRQPNFRFVLEILIKIQKMFPRFISPIKQNNVNIIRQTQNWKLIKFHINSRSFQGMYSYNVLSRVQFAQHSLASIRQDIFDQRVNTERRLLNESEGQKNKSGNKKFLNEIEDSIVIGQEYQNQNQISVRTQQKILSPGTQLKLNTYESQESKIIAPFQKNILYTESNHLNTDLN